MDQERKSEIEEELGLARENCEMVFEEYREKRI
jgi:hypothetical protein